MDIRTVYHFSCFRIPRMVPFLLNDDPSESVTLFFVEPRAHATEQSKFTANHSSKSLPLLPTPKQQLNSDKLRTLMDKRPDEELHQIFQTLRARLGHYLLSLGIASFGFLPFFPGAALASALVEEMCGALLEELGATTAVLSLQPCGA